MKRTIAILLTAIFSVIMLAGCSSDESGGFGFFESGADQIVAFDSGANMAMIAMEEAETDWNLRMSTSYAFDFADAARFEDTLYEMPAPPEIYQSAETAPAGSMAGAFAERIIHTVSANIETMEFDETIERVYQMLELNGGFIENAHVGGRTITQRREHNFRNATFTLRIPQFLIDYVAGNLDGLGNVTSVWRNAQNVTAQFIDTEARLTSLRLQEERLLYMLSEATRIVDMIDIEQRISNVRFEIEHLTSSLMNLQNRVSFSTLTLNIFEVEEYTEPPPIINEPRTYWQRIGDGFSETAQNVGLFFTGLFGWFIINSPVLVILAGIAIPAVIIIRKKLRAIKMHTVKIIPIEPEPPKTDE